MSADPLTKTRQLSKRARTALVRSIAHWRRLADGVKGEPGPGSDTCALCALYIDNMCRACPVRHRTTFVGCFDTPYDNAIDAWASRGRRSPSFKTAAQREVDFLTEILTERGG